MKHILLVTDVKGWAWHHMAHGLKKYSPEACHVLTQEQFWVISSECKFLLPRFDSVLQYSWADATNPTIRNGLEFKRRYTLLASHGAEYEYPPNGDSVPEKIATPLRSRQAAKKAFPKYNGVLCVTEKLRKIAEECGGRAVLTLPGVDDEIYCPGKRRDGILSVGWCGQSLGLTKGYQEVLSPLLQTRLKGCNFQLNNRTAESALTQQEMADWYRGLDVFLSTSCSEGFQMPTLEAMACGVPVIATDVGGVGHLVTKETGWVVPAWTTESDAADTIVAIDRILASVGRDEYRCKGESARRRVETEFSWKIRAPEWTKALLA